MLLVADVFAKVKAGEMSLDMFESWVNEQTRESYMDGNEVGYSNGYDAGLSEAE